MVYSDLVVGMTLIVTGELEDIETGQVFTVDWCNKNKAFYIELPEGKYFFYHMLDTFGFELV
jgi:hypothetical protein